jgi:hypothetical protein
MSIPEVIEQQAVVNPSKFAAFPFGSPEVTQHNSRSLLTRAICSQ